MTSQRLKDVCNHCDTKCSLHQRVKAVMVYVVTIVDIACMLLVMVCLEKSRLQDVFLDALNEVIRAG